MLNSGVFLRSLSVRGLAVWSLAAWPACAGTLSIVHNFTGGADGAVPYKSVSVDSAGNIYGENYWGADTCPDSYEFAGIGCGAVFRISPSGVTTPLVTFMGATNGATGALNVTLYKGYVVSGAYDGGPADLGVMFAVKATGGGYRLLHAFSGLDGSHPNSFPRIAADGTLYSVASQGGPVFTGDGTGFGVLFSITPSFRYVPQHYFSGGADGGSPGRMFIDASGTIYGATGSGGSCTGSGLPASGCGVVYSFVPSTGVFTTLYTFTGGADGYLPQLGGIASDGSLVGATTYGGSAGYGTLFKLAQSGTGYAYKLLHAFTGGSDGANPFGPPSIGNGGTLVGDTFYGPVTATSSGAGVLYTFKGTTLTTLFTFSNDANGGYPNGTPIQLTSGSIIGTTAYGGSNATCVTSGGTLISTFGCGTVFEYTP